MSLIIAVIALLLAVLIIIVILLRGLVIELKASIDATDNCLASQLKQIRQEMVGVDSRASKALLGYLSHNKNIAELEIANRQKLDRVRERFSLEIESIDLLLKKYNEELVADIKELRLAFGLVTDVMGKVIKTNKKSKNARRKDVKATKKVSLRSDKKRTKR